MLAPREDDVLAKEDLIVETPDGRQVAVMAGTLVPPHLVPAYRQALDGGTKLGEHDPHQLALTGKTGDDLVALLRDDKPTVDALVAAVGEDRELAAAVLDAEGVVTDGKPRGMLVKKLTPIAERSS